MQKKGFVLILVIFMVFFLTGCDQLYFNDYEASGVVKDSSGSGIESAQVNFSDGSSVETLADGSWKQTGLNGDIEITPQKEGYTFNPSVYRLSQLDNNKTSIVFSADSDGTESSDDISDDSNDDSDGTEDVEGTYTAEGTITSKSGEVIPEVKLNFSDGSASVKTGTNGVWEKTGLSGDVTVTPEIEGWQFEPANITLNSDNKIVEFTASPAENYSHYSLSGVIYNNNGSNLIIKFEKEDGTVINSTVTDENGNWEVNHVWGKVIIKPQIKGEVISYGPDVKTVSVEDDNIKFTAVLADQSYTATGTITDESDNPVEGVNIRFNDGEFGSVKTNAAGEWTKGGLTGEVSVSPIKTGYTFNPDSISVSTADEFVDFTAIKSYTASGSVTNEDNIAIPYVIINFSDGSSVNTGSEGNWEKPGLTGEVTVTPELDDWQFAPANKTVDETNNIADFTAQPADNHEYYTLSGVIENNGGANIHIEIRRVSDNTLIANAITDDDGNWITTSVWGSVIVTPQVTGSITGFTPDNQSFSGPETEVNFRADY